MDFFKKVDRRQILASMAALSLTPSVLSAPARADSQAEFIPSTYPDPRVEVVDKRFTYKIGNASVQRIATGSLWAEGPVYFADWRSLLWSDAPNNRIMRFCEDDGRVSIYRSPSNFSNGNTRDKNGRLVSCEHGTRRVTRTEHDGTITVLAERYNGKRFNAPNDVIVDSQGAIWFTDPGYGTENPYEGFVQQQELPRAVYRIDPVAGTVKVVADDLIRPNGLTLSPDEKLLYIVDSEASPSHNACIKVYEVNGGALRKGKLFADNFSTGTTDGVKVDHSGNIWCSMGWAEKAEQGARCYAPSGELIGKIHLPELCANLCFGGKDKSRLFMAASTSIYALYLNDWGV